MYYRSEPDGELSTSPDFLPRLRLLYPEGVARRQEGRAELALP